MAYLPYLMGCFSWYRGDCLEEPSQRRRDKSTLIPMTENPTEADAVTLVSYNRPLTRAARRALSEYGIIDSHDPNEHGRWTVVEVKTEPPVEVLDQHELRIERDDDPDVVYETPHDEHVEIYADRVVSDGREIPIDPDEAKSRAESYDWTRVDQQA